MAVPLDFTLEPDISQLPNGSKINVLAEILIFCPGCHICRTAVKGIVFRSDALLAKGSSTFTILGGEVGKFNEYVWVHSMESSHVIMHHQLGVESLSKVIEACAGIGAVGQGFAECNVKTCCYCDSNSKYCEWLQAKTGGEVPIIHGDIADIDTIASIAAASGGPAILSGGISCQPYSGLGDRREQDDPRSQSGPSLLKLGFLLRSPMIIIECTKEALNSDWLQQHLTTFTKETGYRLVQDILHLHSVWPSSRTRWWAILTRPELKVTHIPPMPSLSFEPSIVLLVQIQSQLSDDAMAQLTLDLYELRHFYSKPGGIASSVVDFAKRMGTATHSWGTQLSPCHCGCRKGGFSLRRLQEKGLYGVLIPLFQKAKMGHEEVHNMRHPHPEEVAFLNGLSPDYLETKTGQTFALKFLLSGVGQLASPLQGAWVLSNALAQIAVTDVPVQAAEPRNILCEMGLKLMNQRFAVWPHQVNNRYTDLFVAEFIKLHTDPWRVHGLMESCTNLTSLEKLRNNEWSEDMPSGSTCPVKMSGDLFPTEVQDGEHDKDKETQASCILPASTSFPPEDAVKCEIPRTSMVVENENGDIPTNLGEPDLSVSPASVGVPIAEGSEDVPQQATVVSTRLADQVQRVACALQKGTKRTHASDDAGIPRPPMTNCTPFHANPAHATDMAGPSHNRTKGGMNPPKIENNVSHDHTRLVEVSPVVEEVGTTQTYLPSGGVAAFANPSFGSMDRPVLEVALPKSDTVETAIAEPIGSFDSEESPPSQATLPLPTSQDIAQSGMVWIGHERQDLHMTKLNGHPTVGQVVQAEATLLELPVGSVKPVSIVGSEIAVSQKVQGQQTILIRPIANSGRHRCPLRTVEKEVPDIGHLPRLLGLCNQLGWVADDEMTFYLANIPVKQHCTVESPMILQDNPADTLLFGKVVMNTIEKAFATQQQHVTCAAVWFRHHWFPIRIQADPSTDELQVTSTPGELSFVQAMLFQSFGESHFTYTSQVNQSRFQADCGFQTVAWIQCMVSELDWIHTWTMEAEEAISLRERFADHIQATGQAQSPCHHVILGGMPDTHVKDIAQLVEKHGVRAARSLQVAQHVVTTLGAAAVHQVLKSPNQWKDLKSRCNMSKPPIQLVMADELQEQIDSRIQAGKSFGKKSQKAAKQHHNKQQQHSVVQLKAAHVQVPEGIFQQADGKGLQQIGIHEIQYKKRGVAVLNMDEAAPFFNLTEPLTNEGFAILVVDYKVDELPQGFQISTFPATCALNSEPMIVKAAMIQAGVSQVSRSVPANPLSIDEVATKVVRCLVFRDQYPHDWQTLATRPVKTLLGLDVFGSLDQQGILDVWDRQFMSKLYQKAKPDQAEVFSVTMRLTTDTAQILALANANGGLYFEPRSTNGRSPCPNCKVVWLPRKSYQETVIAKQQTEVNTALARSGDRYGLRSLASEVEKVHAQHRPEMEYLDSSSMRQFQVCPLPFGTTKASLQQVFTKWQWRARPAHPQGQNAEHTGLAWVAFATENPPCWVWTMQHGDVLITEITPSRPQQKAVVESHIIASQRTLKHLSKPKLPGPEKDPWLTQDPWQTSPSTGQSISQSQVAKIEANVEKKILATIQERSERNTSSTAEDAAMETQDDRITALEAKFAELSDNVQAIGKSTTQFQTQQQQHNQHIAQQVQHTQQQMEQQSKRVETMLDQKLESQMAKIEALLTKRPRQE